MPDYKRFVLPDTAEGLTDAEILSWQVKPGDDVVVNQILVEIETAKAAVELPSPWAGKVTELLVEAGQTAEVGSPIIVIDVDPTGEAPAPSANGSAPAQGGDDVPNLVGYGPKTQAARRRSRKAPAAAVTTPAEPVQVVEPEPEPEPVAAPRGGYVPLAKPPVRKLARELGVDLHVLTGTGPSGVITREDVQRATAEPEPVRTVVGSPERERRVPVKGVRRATAQAMVSSAFTAPHVTEFLTVDVTPMMELRARLKSDPRFAAVRLTPLAFAAKAV
ncbi:MAG TPA: biotin/lipoyl-containing protein, partial [Pseudonocardiaceae bacterium]|nr:biotin/lipoyl-containing protein [Pseudonocardiaceae bacterium]